MAEVLRSLDFEVKDGKVFVPSFRGDVECMNDLAEEVARIYGYNNIPATPMRGEVADRSAHAHAEIQRKAPFDPLRAGRV